MDMTHQPSLEQWGEPTSLVDYDLQVLRERYLAPPKADFDSSPLARKLGNLPTRTFVAINSQFAGMNTGDRTLRVNAYQIDALARGRQESKHEVWFAELVLSSKEQSEHAELVAMKPNTAKALAREFHASEVLAERLMPIYGRRVTFENLGFFFDQLSWQGNSVTRYEYGVQSMDRMMWSRENMPTQDQVIDVFDKAAETMGVAHGVAGIALGDPQPKNIVTDPKGVRFNDLEEASDLQTPDGSINTLKAEKLIKKDLESFLLVLGGDYTDLVKEYFATPYAERVAQAGLIPTYVQLSVDEIVKLSRQPQRDVPYMGPRF
jgi:hypothetical protein